MKAGAAQTISTVVPDKARVSDPLKRADISKRRLATGPKSTEMGRKATAKAVDFACEALISCEQMLNTMDSGAGTYCRFFFYALSWRLTVA